MQKTNAKIGKKGGAKRVAEELTKIRKTPISKEVFEIVDRHNEKPKSNPAKKSAKPASDLEI